MPTTVMVSTDQDSMTVHERFEEMDRFFAGTGKVHTTLPALASNLNHCGISYAVIGGMALNAHGYRRETGNLNILVRADGLEIFRRRFEGSGYMAVSGSKMSFIDTTTRVEIHFAMTGMYPGDGKPKPVAFPDPALSIIEIRGIKVVNLLTLIELKLASGMTQPARLRDLADVQDLIRTLRLGAEFANRLDPYVRAAFMTLLKELDTPDPHREGPDA